MNWTWSPSQRLVTQGPRAKAHPTPRERERQTASSPKRRRKGEEDVEDVDTPLTEEAPGRRCQQGMATDPQGGEAPGRRSPGEARPQGDEAPGWRCRQGIPREAEFTRERNRMPVKSVINLFPCQSTFVNIADFTWERNHTSAKFVLLQPETRVNLMIIS